VVVSNKAEAWEESDISLLETLDHVLKYYKLTTPILGRAGAERAADAIEALDAGATAGDVLSAVRWSGTIRVR
jgi:dihydroorotate dehydrogenase